MDDRSRPTRPSAWEILALASILVLATALRVRELIATPLWVDEIYILSVARQPLHAALDTVARDIHPPLWFALTHFWIAIGGTGERWLKALPLLCSLTGIVGAFALARRFGGAGAGLVAALLLTLNTTHIHWSQQLEDYSLVWALLTWLVLAAWSLHERPGRGTAAGLLLVGILALYTDYLASFVMVLIAAWGAWTLRHHRPRLRWWIATLALLALLFIPQLPIWARQFAREGYGSHFHWPTLPALVRLARVVSFGPAWMPLVTAALTAIALARPDTRRGTVLILVACLPLLFATRAWPLVVQRDMLYLLPLVYVLVGVGLAGIRWRPVLLGLMGLFLMFAVRRVATAHPWAEPLALRRVETRLRATTRPGDLLLHAEPHTLFYFEYHLPAWRNRLLQPPGERVPYFDTGLMIADSTYWTPDDWHAHVARGGGWNAMLADRAFVQYGIPSRAGAWARAQFDSARADTTLEDPPIHLWIGRPAARDSAIAR